MNAITVGGEGWDALAKLSDGYNLWRVSASETGHASCEEAARGQLFHFLLRQGGRYPAKSSWSKTHLEWIRFLRSGLEAEKRVLVEGLHVDEAPWSCRFTPKVSAEIRKRNERLPAEVHRIAWSR